VDRLGRQSGDGGKNGDDNGGIRQHTTFGGGKIAQYDTTGYESEHVEQLLSRARAAKERLLYVLLESGDFCLFFVRPSMAKLLCCGAYKTTKIKSLYTMYNVYIGLLSHMIISSFVL